MRAGIALNPGTPMSYVDEVVDDLDMVLIMTVNPGYPAQRYIPAATKKIARTRKILDNAGSAARLQVDGGINLDTINTAYQAGADTFVAGSAIFKAENPGREVGVLREACIGSR
jgi:ribulose-phosphate 3-epimerase